MATFNTNTVKEEARLEELAHCVEERGVEILGVQEHRRVHADRPILHHKVGACTFVTSSAWRSRSHAANGGVGLMLSPRARRALRSVHQHTARILVAEFEGNPVTTVMCVYSPTNVAHHVAEVEEFYSTLRSAIQRVPAHNFLVILGDFNARLGPQDAPFTFHDSTNANGEHLAALLVEHGLLAANTLFKKRLGKRWTFRDRGTNTLRQLDYVLVRRKWRSSVLNAEPYSSFHTVGSDHRVVTVRLRLSLRAPKATPRSRPDWEAFARSPDLQASYTADVRGQLQLSEGTQPTYEQFLAASKEATSRWVPLKGKLKNSPTSRHPDVTTARVQMEEASKEWESEGSEESREKLSEAKRKLYEAYDQVEGRKLMEEVKRRHMAIQGGMEGNQRYK